MENGEWKMENCEAISEANGKWRMECPEAPPKIHLRTFR
jgi:hypothetical protein